MNVPYNTGKISIGKYYQPPRYIETDPDMLEIQSYLIHDPRILKRNYWIKKCYMFFLLLGLTILLLKN